MSPATATPHGFACLTITHAGSSNWRTHSNAVSPSAMLLYESVLALQLLRGADAGARCIGDRVERRALMRVLAVAKIHALAEVQRQRLWIFFLRALSRLRHARQITRDCSVIACGVCVGLCRETLARLFGNRAIGVRQLIEHRRVVERIDDDRDAIVILRRRAHHRGSTDVDVLDRVFISAVGLGDGGRERIKIHDHQVDGLDAVRAHDCVIDVATAEQAAVNFRVQRLDAPIHDFRKAGVRRHLRDRDAVLFQQARGAAGRKNRDAATLQRLREFHQAIFVGNTQQRAANRNGRGRHYLRSRLSGPAAPVNPASDRGGGAQFARP